MQRKRVSFNRTARVLQVRCKYAIVAHCQVNSLVLVRKPNQPDVRNDQIPGLTTVPFCVFHLAETVDYLFARAATQLGYGHVESNFTVLPNELCNLRDLLGRRLLILKH